MQNNSLIGNLVSTPELNTSGENPWTKIRVAVSDVDTLFVDVFFSGKTAEQIAQYLEKGRQVYVEYRLRNNEYTKDNVKIKTLDLYGTKCVFLNKKEVSSNEN